MKGKADEVYDLVDIISEGANAFLYQEYRVMVTIATLAAPFTPHAADRLCSFSCSPW